MRGALWIQALKDRSENASENQVSVPLAFAVITGHICKLFLRYSNPTEVHRRFFGMQCTAESFLGYLEHRESNVSYRSVSLIIIWVSSLYSFTSAACTTACLSGAKGPLITKSYDWHSTAGLVMVNKAGVKKKAFLVGPGIAAEWTSQYASVTFNQYGREMPNGGMNTAGLVVEVMWLAETKTPAIDERPAITELQWIQYQLDNYATLKQVVENAPKIRVSKVYGQVHYMVCERSGRCATFEYLNGALVTNTGPALPAPVLTNHNYRDSVRYLKQHKRFGGTNKPKRGPGSLDRFTRAATFVEDYPQKATVTNGFDLLDQVSQGKYSVWNIVYDPNELRVYFRTLDSLSVKSVALKRFDPSCTSPVKTIDINTNRSGDISRYMVDYTLEENRSLVTKVFRQLGGLPSILTLAITGYPERQICTIGR